MFRDCGARIYLSIGPLVGRVTSHSDLSEIAVQVLVHKVLHPGKHLSLMQTRMVVSKWPCWKEAAFRKAKELGHSVCVELTRTY